MAVRTEEMRDLVDFAPEGFLVTNFFLDVNAKEFPDSDHVQKSADSLLHTARAERDTVAENLPHDASESLRQDLEKIQDFVANGFQRTDTNGLVIYSCAAMDFWEVVQLPDPVQNRVEFTTHPYVAPIAAYLSHHKPTAILMVDKEHARIFTVSGGEVREWADIENFVPQRSSQGGWSQSRYQRRNDNFARHNVDQGTELVLKLLQIHPFDWLIIGAEVQMETVALKDLHPYLKDRVIGTIHLGVGAGVAEIVEKAGEVIEQAEEQLIERLVGQIQEFAGAGGRGTIGLADTLKALNEQKVHVLLFQQGFTHPGSVCTNCEMMFDTQTERCPTCSEAATVVENIVETAVQRAYELGSVVEVATEFNQLEAIQNIGSVMYY